jgi:hypothetical protein
VSSKIDVRKIIRAHLATFHDADKTSRASIQDMLVFLGLPIASRGYPNMARHWCIEQPGQYANHRDVRFRCPAFYLLILIYDVAMRTDYSSGGNARLRIMFVKEIHANIEFAILVTIISIVALVARLSRVPLKLRWRSPPDACRVVGVGHPPRSSTRRGPPCRRIPTAPSQPTVPNSSCPSR